MESLGTTVGKELLKPHRCYIKSVLPVLNQRSETRNQKPLIKGMAHLTGGGFYDNIPRILPKHISIKIYKNSWPILPIFQLLQKDGNISDKEMYHVFNMGIGMMIIVSEKEYQDVIDHLRMLGEKAYMIGVIEKRDNKQDQVYLCES